MQKRTCYVLLLTLSVGVFHISAYDVATYTTDILHRVRHIRKQIERYRWCDKKQRDMWQRMYELWNGYASSIENRIQEYNNAPSIYEHRWGIYQLWHDVKCKQRIMAIVCKAPLHRVERTCPSDSPLLTVAYMFESILYSSRSVRTWLCQTVYGLTPASFHNAETTKQEQYARLAYMLCNLNNMKHFLESEMYRYCAYAREDKVTRDSVLHTVDQLQRNMQSYIEPSSGIISSLDQYQHNVNHMLSIIPPDQINNRYAKAVSQFDQLTSDIRYHMRQNSMVCNRVHGTGCFHVDTSYVNIPSSQ